jgi:hypothetical protein
VEMEPVLLARDLEQVRDRAREWEGAGIRATVLVQDLQETVSVLPAGKKCYIKQEYPAITLCVRIVVPGWYESNQ